MTPEALLSWIDACREAGVFSSSQPKRDAAASLGISDNALTNRLSGKVRIRAETAMACRAIFHRLEPWE